MDIISGAGAKSGFHLFRWPGIDYLDLIPVDSVVLGGVFQHDEWLKPVIRKQSPALELLPARVPRGAERLLVARALQVVPTGVVLHEAAGERVGEAEDRTLRRPRRVGTGGAIVVSRSRSQP